MKNNNEIAKYTICDLNDLVHMKSVYDLVQKHCFINIACFDLK